MLPPPAIQGRLASVGLAGGRLHQIISNGQHAPTSLLAPADSKARHYVYLFGNDIRFGKLLMSNADLRTYMPDYNVTAKTDLRPGRVAR